MGLPYLKLKPEEAIKLIDECIVKGYELKDEINNEYFNNKSAVTDEKINKWSNKLDQWTDTTKKELKKIFVSLKESYNFRDAPTSGLYRMNTNAKWNGIINKLEARISKLNQYDTDIHNNFSLNLEVIGGDKIVQTGENNKLKIKK